MAQNTFVFNVFNNAHSTYSNHTFNSYFKLNNEYYGIDGAGVWKLHGSLDGTRVIGAQLDTPVSSFEKQNLKACSDVYLLARPLGNIKITAITDERSASTTYINKTDYHTGLHRIRTKISKGLKGATWQFRINNIGGSNFNINNLEARIRELKRTR
jgi:hypothetical protein